MPRKNSTSSTGDQVARAIERNIDAGIRELDGLLKALGDETCGSPGYNALWTEIVREMRSLSEWKRLRSAARRLR